MPDISPDWVQAFADESTTPSEFSEKLWNFVEGFEKRADAQLMREMTLALPVEFTIEENVALVRDFVQEHVTARGMIADWAYHDAPGNPHIHLMTTLRPLSEDGFGSKRFALRGENGEPVRNKKGQIVYGHWGGGKQLIEEWREAWATVQNEHLARHGFEVRVDHRTNAEQGIDIEPTMHRGPTSEGMDQRGATSDRIEDLERERAETLASLMTDPGLVLKRITAEKAVFDERDIARVIHRYADTAEDFQNLFLRVGALEEMVTVQAPAFDPFTGEILERAKFTTREVIETEIRMLQAAETRLADKGWDVRGRKLNKVVAAVEDRRGFSFSEEQKAAIEHVTKQEGMSVIVGYAGAGKSTVMDAVREVYEGDGRRVVGGALSGKASEELAQSAGINSRTLASWELAWQNEKHLLQAGDVFVLDEAGMVASAQMSRIVETIDKAGAKLIVVGDARQLQPIQAGAAFRALADVGGYYELTEVRRQYQEWMQKASIQFGRGETADALQTYIDRGALRLSETRAEARDELLQAWRSDWQAGAEVLILAHTNADVQALNIGARSVIKELGGLAEESGFQTARGSRMFSAGDRIIFLENDRNVGVRNGMLGTVAEAGEGHLTVALDVGRTVEVRQSEYSNVDHGYAATVHKSQGATVERVHVLATPMMDSHLTYVAMTRHRDEVKLYAGAEVFEDPRAGRLVEHGEAPYEHKEENTDSYYVTLENRKGKQHTIWGVDLPRALAEAGSDIGDRIKLEQDGSETVTLPDGNTAQRNKWKVVAAKDMAPAQVVRSLSRDAMKETTISYRDTVDFKEAVEAFAQRRGIPTWRDLGEIFQAHTNAFRRRLDGFVRRFNSVTERLGLRSSVRQEQAAPRAADTTQLIQQAPAALAFPKITPEVNQALHRLAHSYAVTGLSERRHRGWFRNASYELEDSRHADQVKRFAQGITELIPRSEVVHIGPKLTDDTRQKISERLPERVVEALAEHWPRVHAVQRAAHDLDLLATARAVQADHRDRAIEAEYEADRAKHRTPERPLIKPVTIWPQPLETVARQRTEADPARQQLHASAIGEFSKVWRDPHAALRFAFERLSTGREDLGALIAQIHKEPAALNELRGRRSLIGRPDEERAAALAAVPLATGAFNELVGRENRLVAEFSGQERRFRELMRQPIDDLSPAARYVVSKVQEALRHPVKSQERGSALTVALKDEKAVAEIRSRAGELRERFGQTSGHGLDVERLRSALQASSAERIDDVMRTVQAIVSTDHTRQTFVAEQQQQHRQKHNQRPDLGHSM